MPTLSIIAVVFNEAKHVAGLQSAVNALLNSKATRVETILVDGGSRDGTAAAARRAGFSKVIEQPGANIPQCRNRGLQEAAGDWIAYLDGDCEPAPDWLEQARPFLENNEALILGWPAQPPEPMTWVQAAWNFHWTQKNRRMEIFQGRLVVLNEGFRLATTRNMILHRAVSEKIGGFNEELATGEDTDFAYRAYLAKIPVLGVPELKVVHHGEPATLGRFFRQQIWHANRGSYRHIMKASGGKVGGNAPKFAAAFLVTALLAIAALVGSLFTGNWLLLALAAPLLGIVALPAARLCVRAGTWKYFGGLIVLYAAYGAARAYDLLGLSPSKPSWKSAS
jgi:glycosyltransferase involved in cell wall biosynthesis